MEDILVPITIFVTFFGSIAYIAKVIGDTRIRRKVLEARVSADVAEAILSGGWKEPSTRSALKWGLVIVSLGVGLLLVDVFGIDFESPLAYAVLLLATGTALLGYYVIERDGVETLDEPPTVPPTTDEPSPAEERVESEA
jgi:hypothetical protein